MTPRGTVLIVVMFLMVAVSLLALSLAYRAGTRLKIVKHELIHAHLDAQADSAAAIAVSRLKINTNGFDHGSESWGKPFSSLTTGLLPDWEVKEGQKEPEYIATFQVIDEDGKLNVNNASSTVLQKLGLSPEQIDSLFDWMDADENAKPGGAESQDYLAARGYRSPNRPMQTLQEFLLIKGFTGLDYLGEDANGNGILDPNENDGAISLPLDNADGILKLGVRDVLTCVGDGRININTAPRVVLEQLPISSKAVDQIIGYRAFDANTNGKLEDHAFKSIDDIKTLQGISQPEADVLEGLVKYRSDYFRIFIDARHVPTGLRRTQEILVKMEDGEPKILEIKGGP